MNAAHPILTCDETKAFEAALFAGDEAREWTAMQRAGRAVADAVLGDFEEIGGFPSAGGRVLVLAGKGHNAGDALIAAKCIKDLNTSARIDVCFVFGERALRPLAARAWRGLAADAHAIPAGGLLAGAGDGYDLVFDGVFGFQFRPPLAPEVAAVLDAANALPIRFRAAVDLPSGLDASSAFRADFTYATGIVKAPLLTLPNVGRLRYLDLGFFNATPEPICHLIGDKTAWVLTQDVLRPLRGLRASGSDKRTYGHVFIVGGSRGYPGAVMMSVLAAVHSGAGLVTAFVPETLVAAFAAQVPEAMWVAWPETPDGGLALEGAYLLREKMSRASALLVGPGLGREPETLLLAKEIVAESAVPVVIDADALQPDIVAAGSTRKILTPHAGEFARIERRIGAGTIVVRKGPVTTVQRDKEAYHSFFGGPVLARGGSGDILAGLTAGLLAQAPDDPLGAALRGVAWHGLAAGSLARTKGQVAVRTTELIEHLSAALRIYK